MALIHQPIQCAGHTKLCIQRLWAENQDPLVCRIRRNRAMRVIGVGFTSRPPGDRMLQLVKNSDIEAISRANLYQKRSKTVLGVVFVAKPEHRFLQAPRDPYHGFPSQLGGPLNWPNLPRCSE